MKWPHCLVIALLASLAILPIAQSAAGQAREFRFNRDNTPGWMMMNEQERANHRAQMLSFKSYDECTDYMEQHRKTMEGRAGERGRARAMGGADACERMKAAGMFGN
jgi:hypothetical protein